MKHDPYFLGETDEQLRTEGNGSWNARAWVHVRSSCSNFYANCYRAMYLIGAIIGLVLLAGWIVISKTIGILFGDNL